MVVMTIMMMVNDDKDYDDDDKRSEDDDIIGHDFYEVDNVDFTMIAVHEWVLFGQQERLVRGYAPACENSCASCNELH